MNIKNPLPDESLITLVRELFIYTNFFERRRQQEN